MKPFIIIALLLGLNCLHSNAQQQTGKRKLTHLSLSFTNSHTAMPFGKFSSLITENYHPGLEFSTGFDWKTGKKHDWTQSFNVGYSYHRWVQHSLMLYSEAGYRYKFGKGFYTEARLGAGYMRALVAAESFSDGVEDGNQYAKVSSGRSQFIANFRMIAGKQFNSPQGIKVFIGYQQRLQTPFIHSYVPLLPYNILELGFALPIKRS